MKKSISLHELAKHSNKNDCWIAIKGNVYDVSSYMDLHPGADEILKGCGINATLIYETKNGLGHSPEADTILDTYYIGTLSENEE